MNAFAPERVGKSEGNVAMSLNVDELIRELNPAERKKVEDRAAEIIAEEMSLRDPLAIRSEPRPPQGRMSLTDAEMKEKHGADMIRFGICPTKGCPLSYENERAIVGWYSARSLPGSAGLPGGSLPSQLRKVFQNWGPDSKFCRECGTALVTSNASIPSLGECPGCKRAYKDEDLNSNFCANCGHPIDPTEKDAVRERSERHSNIRNLLGLVPRLPL